jgi:oligosaccharide translocation protein RFT1
MASPKAYGVAAIQFELMSSTILFLSREGVRGSLLRVKGSVGDEKEKEWKAKAKEQEQSSMNVGFIPIFFGIPLAIITCLLYTRFASVEAKEQGYFGWAVLLYGVAAIVELLAEPMHNLYVVIHHGLL